MKFVENGVPEDFAKLCISGTFIPICELTEDEVMSVIKTAPNINLTKQRTGCSILPVLNLEANYENMAIEKLGLSLRAANCLVKNQIMTVGQLCNLTEAELGSIRGMGARSVAEIKAVLAAYGLALKNDDSLPT